MRVDWPPPYKDATEKYSSQVQLSKDHRSLIGYVAGQPFPLIDANDPDVATKIVWNNVFRPIRPTTTICAITIATRCTPVATSRSLKSRTGRSGTTPVMTWSAGPKSSRCRSIPISRRPTAYGCSCSDPSSRPRTLVAPASCAIATPAESWRRSWTWTSGTRRLRRLNEVDHVERDAAHTLGSRSLFGLQSQDRTVRLQVTRREGDARDALTPSIHLKSAAPPMAAAAHAPSAGRCATCTS